MDHAHRAPGLRARAGLRRASRRRWPPTRASTTASWSRAWSGDWSSDQTDVKVFFLVCVVVAGVYGAATVNRRILVVQAVPAALALVGASRSADPASSPNHGRHASTPDTSAVGRPARQASAGQPDVLELERHRSGCWSGSARCRRSRGGRETASDGALSVRADETAARHRGARRRAPARRCASAVARPRPRTSVASQENESTVLSSGNCSPSSACTPTTRPSTSTARSRHHDVGRPRAAVLPDLGDQTRRRRSASAGSAANGSLARVHLEVVGQHRQERVEVGVGHAAQHHLTAGETQVEERPLHAGRLGPLGVGRRVGFQPAAERLEVAGRLAAQVAPLPLLADGGGEAELEDRVEASRRRGSAPSRARRSSSSGVTSASGSRASR